MPMAKNKWLILVVLSLALFLVAVDMSVLYIALPTLTHALQASTTEKLWIINMYPLVVAGFLLSAGTLGDRMGHQRLLHSGLVIFAVGSLLAAYAPSPTVLICARALLGIGGAAMMPATLAILRLSFEHEQERSLAIGIWAAVASGGTAMGPLLGGLLLEHYHWGSVFLINVPIVGLIYILSCCLIQNVIIPNAKPWDFIGSLLLTITFLCLAYTIKTLAYPAFSYQHTGIALMAFLFCLYALIQQQKRSAYAIIDMNLFRNSSFNSAVFAGLAISACLMGMNLVLSQRLQLVQEFSPLRAGFYFLPLSLGAIVASPIGGWLLPRFHSRLYFLSSALLAYATAIVLFIVSLHLSIYAQVFCLFLMGACFGISMTAASDAIMGMAPPEQAGMAASVEEISYELGAGMGIAVMGSIMTWVYNHTLDIPSSAHIDPQLAQDGIDHVLILAKNLPTDVGGELLTQARLAFDRAVFTVMAAAALMLSCAGMSIYILARKHNYGPPKNSETYQTSK